MLDALAGLPINLEEQPEGIVTVRIDSDTGERASENSTNSRFEIFKLGTEPLIERGVDVNSGSNEPDKRGIPGLPSRRENVEEDIF